MLKPVSDPLAAAASAMGARTAHACDGCMRRLARWHCIADDAFLCQACDISVHSANPLARRHHRVRLAASSSSSSTCFSPSSPPVGPNDPSWLHSLKRRARTPRAKPGCAKVTVEAAAMTATVVPDLEVEEEEEEEKDEGAEELVYRVPVFNPMLAELCDVHVADEPETEMRPYMAVAEEAQPSSEFSGFHLTQAGDAGQFAGFHVSDSELTDFAANMESLLTGVHGEVADFDDLGFLEEGHVVPDEKALITSHDMDMQTKSESAVTMQDELRESVTREKINQKKSKGGAIDRKKTMMMLTLDYEGVITAWSNDRCSPWFHGEHPRLKPGEPWPDFPVVRWGVGAVVAPATGGEREARVSRYREKRRSRLFAKKIRYEVRKLNAEKRPRMNGRFVKRTAFPQVPKFVAGPRRFTF